MHLLITLVYRIVYIITCFAKHSNRMKNYTLCQTSAKATSHFE